MDEIFDFFQYPENYDKLMLGSSLKKLSCTDGEIIFQNMKFNHGFECNKQNALGFFLANIPLMLNNGIKGDYSLTPKLKKLKNDTEELINMGKFNELATLDLYLLLEMAMRCAYSKWLGNRIVISKYNMKDTVLEGYDYRRLKLYIRLNKLGRTDIEVNGEPFPGSQNSLLHWATKFMDRQSSLMFRLSLNVRNLLAHGENEWNLYPVSESVSIASMAAGKLLSEVKPGMATMNSKKGVTGNYIGRNNNKGKF
jgi:hypothetical protein